VRDLGDDAPVMRGALSGGVLGELVSLGAQFAGVLGLPVRGLLPLFLEQQAPTAFLRGQPRGGLAEGGEHGDRLRGALPDFSGNVGMLVGSDLIHQPSPRIGVALPGAAGATRPALTSSIAALRWRTC